MGIPKDTLKALNALRPPVDYFGDTRTSENLWPHNILCFVRKSHQETAAEPLSRNHHHRHNLIIPLEGAGTVYVDDRQFTIQHPEILLIHPFQYHHGFNFDRDRVLWLFVTFEIASGAALEALRLEPVRTPKKDDFPIVWNFVDAWSSRKKDGELAYWLGLFLTRLLRAPSLHLAGEDPTTDRSSPLLMRINEYCVSNLQHAIRLKELASRLGVSESHLRASFRAETGISLGQHLRRLRLQKAMGLLLQSELSITQIAERCGFDSIYTFSRAFRSFTGMMAKAYRKRFTRN
jgi:AraC-like DNA-binding protein